MNVKNPLLAVAFCLIPALASSVHSQTASTAPATNPALRFEAQVKAYEDADKKDAPPRNAILLVGDSQFFRWKTVNEDLPGYTIINRGIDSFQTSDLLHYVDRLVIPYKPRLIVLHVGGNDVNNNKTPDQILADTKAFVAKVRAAQPDVPIIFSSITPGPGRWDQADRRKAVNAVIKDYAGTLKNATFINLWDAMLTPDGKPREDLWVEDRIHPNHEGYKIRVKLTLPHLGPPDQKLPVTLPATK